MKYLGILLFLALALVPMTAAAPAPDEAPILCKNIVLILGQGAPGTNLVNFSVFHHPGDPYVNEPWILFFGPTAHVVPYHNCFFWPDPIFQFGPIVGDFFQSWVVPDPAVFTGYWQVLGQHETSNEWFFHT